MARITTFGGTSGGAFAFGTVQTDTGTYPSADSTSDTLTLTSSDGTINITGTAATDTINFVVDTTDLGTTWGYPLYHPAAGSTWERFGTQGQSDAGGQNTVIGLDTLSSLSSGAFNTVFGYSNLLAQTDVTNTVVVGVQAFPENGASAFDKDIFVGNYIGLAASETVTTNSILIGHNVADVAVDFQADNVISIGSTTFQNTTFTGGGGGPVQNFINVGHNSFTLIDNTGQRNISLGHGNQTLVTRTSDCLFFGFGSEASANSATGEICFGGTSGGYTSMYLGRGAKAYTSATGGFSLLLTPTSGTNVNGGDFYISSGSGTGSGTAPTTFIRTFITGASGSTPHTSHDLWTWTQKQSTLSGNSIILNQTAAAVVEVVRGAASQSVDLTQWQNSVGTVLASVDASGRFGVGAGVASDCSIQPQGTASTGMYFPTTTSIGLVTSGTERVTLDTSKFRLSSIGAVESVQTLTDGATIASDWATGNIFTVTLGGNRTLSNPSNASNGQKAIYRIRQDGTGSRTLALDTKFRLGTDITSTTLTTTAGKTDYIGVVYHSADDKFDVIAMVKGY